MTKTEIEEKLNHIKSNIFKLESLYIENSDLIDFSKRKFTLKIKAITPILDEIETLLTRDTTSNKKQFFEFWKSNDESYLNEVTNKLHMIEDSVNKINMCTKCVCASCINQVCNDCCTGCEDELYTSDCNKAEGFRIQTATNWNMRLTDNKIGEEVRLEIKALIDYFNERKKYVYMKNLYDNEHYLQVYNTNALTHVDDHEIFKQFDSDEEFHKIDQIVSRYIG